VHVSGVRVKRGDFEKGSARNRETLFGLVCGACGEWRGRGTCFASYLWVVSWTTDGIRVPRSEFKEVGGGPEVKKAADDEDYALRDVLFEVLGRFPEAHEAVVRAMGERVDVIRARRRNNGNG
jgi:hypothetical protein